MAEPIGIQPRFCFHAIPASTEALVFLSSGGGQPNINQEKLRALRIAVPSMAEQSAIAAFLGHETGKIDALVAEQERLIALLKEERQAVISHAVTKGLDASAPMKESGVAWLGQVPAHWRTGPLKHFWSVTDCKHLTAEFVADGIPLASIREVQSRFVDLTFARQTTDRFHQILIEEGREPQASDLILVEMQRLALTAHPSPVMPHAGRMIATPARAARNASRAVRPCIRPVAMTLAAAA